MIQVIQMFKTDFIRKKSGEGNDFDITFETP